MKTGALLLLAATLAWSQDPPAGYSFFFNGKVSLPMVIQLGPAPAAGDLVLIGGDFLVLPGPGVYKLRVDGANLIHQVDDKTARVISTTVYLNQADEPARIINPLEKMTDAEISGLWGLRLDATVEGIAAKLGKLDGAKSCLNLDKGACREDGSLPALPASLRYLSVRIKGPSKMDLSPLKALSALKFLHVDSLDEPAFDVDWIKGAADLAWVRLTAPRILHSEALGNLAKLTYLDLSSQARLEDCSFARTLSELRTLGLIRTGVTDLSPLGELKNLEIIEADLSPVSRLPDGPMPALKMLRLHSTKVTPEAASAFSKSHPGCRVLLDWMESLKAEVAGATRMRVRTGGTCHRRVSEEKTLVEIKDAAVIKAFIDGIRIGGSAPSCACCGDPTFEFYKGDAKVASLGFHHSQGLRWLDGWPGDAKLTNEGAEYLTRWLNLHQVTGPQEEVEEEKAAALAWQKKIARATAGMPEAVARVFNEDERKFREKLRAEVPDEVAQIRLLVKVFGAGNGPWQILDMIGQRMDKLLREYGVEPLGKAVAEGLRSEDRQLRRGAARFWLTPESPLESWMPKEIGDLRRRVLTVQLEARAFEVRVAALANLQAWKESLPAGEIDSRLATGLRDPVAQVRMRAMLVAGQLGHAASAPVLMDALNGKMAETRELPPVPSEEELEPGSVPPEHRSPYKEWEMAALGLGYMKHTGARELLTSKAKESKYADLGLALLGEVDRVKPAYFEGELPHELQFAAVDAVVRAKGRLGLRDAINYRQSSYWWEEGRAAQRVAAMLIEEKAPGAAMLKDVKDMVILVQWYEKHGAEYLKRFK